ncbi:hypothetical protein E4T56_gene2110 [Termitomyces sp. T112]|nr:hypothetical protein E4T56_gene2110 [Termitomyces sp. T112]
MAKSAVKFIEQGHNHLRAGSAPQNLDILQPVEIVDHLHSSRSHLSVPNYIAPRSGSQVFVPAESALPSQAGLECSVLSIPGNTELSHPRIRPFVPELLQRYARNVKIPKKAFKYTILPSRLHLTFPILPDGRLVSIPKELSISSTRKNESSQI